MSETIASDSPDSVTTISGVLGANISREPTLIAGIDDIKKTALNGWALFLIVGGIFLLSSCDILIVVLHQKGMLSNVFSNQTDGEL